MNLKDKLKGLPTIYYLNLDERPDRKQYTEEQYEKYKISNFKRFSASSYQLQNFDEWKSKVILNDISTCKRWRQHLIEVATALSTIDMLKSWLENTTEEYVILMEDDYDLSYIDYWHFQTLVEYNPNRKECYSSSIPNQNANNQYNLNHNHLPLR